MSTILKLAAPALAASLLMAGCSNTGVAPTYSHPAAVEQQVMLPMSRVAELLDLNVEEGSYYTEVFAQLPNGDGFNIDANRAKTYTFRGLPRKVEDPYIQYKDGEILIPSGMYQSMCKDCGRADAMLKGAASKYDSGLADKVRLHPPEVVLPSAKSTSIESTPTKTGPTTALPAGSLAGKIVVIDAGHGGKDPGGIGHHGKTDTGEKDLVLAVASRVKKLLEAEGAHVLMTRTDDTFVELQDRADLANAKHADLFLSVHANIAADADVSGVECYFQDSGERGQKSATLAKRIVDQVAASSGAVNRGAKTDKRGLRVLRVTEMPAVLIELGYLTNADEAKKLTDSAYQDKLAKGILEGFKVYARG